MRRRIGFLIAVVFSLLLGTKLVSPESQPPEAGEIIRAEEALRQAQLKYDRAAARTTLADEFIGTWNHGERADQEQFLALIADKADPLEILEYSDMKIRVYGDAAVVWSAIHERAVYGGKVDEYRGNRTAVWVKRESRWQCVTIHTSAFAEDH